VNAPLGQRFFDLFQFKVPNNCFDFFHGDYSGII
jgi:hypothetical protein